MGGFGLSAVLSFACLSTEYDNGAGSMCNGNDDCAAALYCDFTIGFGGKCERRQDEGEDCGFKPCLPELACKSVAMGSECGQPTATGEACRGHLECESEYCPRGFCEDRPDRGEECPLGICAGNLQCLGERCQ